MSLIEKLINLYENQLKGTDHQTARTNLPNGGFLIYVRPGFDEEGMGELLRHSLEMAELAAINQPKVNSQVVAVDEAKNLKCLICADTGEIKHYDLKHNLYTFERCQCKVGV